jgi:hypothetical protein
VRPADAASHQRPLPRRAKQFAQKRLFAYNNECVHHILVDYRRKYSKFRMIDLPQLKSAMPLTLSAFESSVRQHIEHSKRVLLEQWFDECKDDERLDLMGDFFEAAMAALMRTLIHTTLDDLIDFLTLYLNGNYYDEAKAARPFNSIYVPHAIVPLVVSLKPDLHTSSAHLEPSIAHVHSSLRHLVDQIVHSLSELPRLETLLFHEHAQERRGERTSLQVSHRRRHAG